MNETQPTKPWIRPFYAGLDGLRAIAFVMVFCAHYYTTALGWAVFRWGWVGVDLFFVLSGFLITGILYDSLHREDFFRNFYIRRALRIFPLFYGFWIAVLLLTPVLHIVLTRYNFLTAAYLGNFYLPRLYLAGNIAPFELAYRSLTRSGATSYLDVTPLWSLCVEEQFYLVWPAVIYFVRSGKSLLRLCLAVILLEPFARALYFHLHPQMAVAGSIFFNSFFRADTLLVGGALALWLRVSPQQGKTLRRVAWMNVVGGLGVFVVLYRVLRGDAGSTNSNWMTSTIGFTLIAIIGGGLLLLAIDPTGRLGRWMQWRPLVFLGRISYGLYFFHELGGVQFNYLGQHLRPHHLMWVVPILAFVTALVLAVLSFRFVESPFLRLKDRLASRPGVADPPPQAS